MTSAGLKYLQRMNQLVELNLDQDHITDEGIKSLACCVSLQKLLLNQTSISDAGLEKLAGVSKLEELSVCGTQVTEAGVKKLQQKLSRCVLTFNTTVRVMIVIEFRGWRCFSKRRPQAKSVLYKNDVQH